MKTPPKNYVLSVRMPFKVARRLRGIAAVDGTTASDLTRDMLVAIFGGDQAKLLAFLGRVQAALVKHANKAVRVPGPDGGLWSPPPAKGRPSAP
jgi:hypothetical protein